jgi:hypothetical protein
VRHYLEKKKIKHEREKEEGRKERKRKKERKRALFVQRCGSVVEYCLAWEVLDSIPNTRGKKYLFTYSQGGFGEHLRKAKIKL